jgi:membrane dipeptidase
MIELDRRLFLGGASVGAALIASPALSSRSDGMLIVNALGGLSDPNGSPPPDKEARNPVLNPRVIQDARTSGMTVVNETIGYVAGPKDPFTETVRDIGFWYTRLRAHPEDLLLVLRADDISRAKREGKIGVILGFQNAAMMGDDASRADIFADLGVRVVQLTYNLSNQLGDGSMVPENRGLSAFGREVIQRLNSRRIMVDLSHSGERTCLDAARASQQPVSINHTGCRALTDLPRNKTDAELRLVAEKGGFVGIYFMPYLNPSSVAIPGDVVAHIEHAIRICGEDHVGIGTDGPVTGIDDMKAYRAAAAADIARRKAAGIGATGERPDTVPWVEGLTGPDQFRTLMRLLRSRGHSGTRIEKIMGLNFLTYAQRVWSA